MTAKTKIDNSWYVKPQGIKTRVSAGGVVVRKENGQALIALIRDTKFEEYTIPKGGVEKIESIKDAAKREIEEETGLSEIRYQDFLGRKERLTFEKKYWAIIDYFLFTTEQIQGNQKLQEGEEDLILEWFSVDNLPLIFWPEQKKLIEENLQKIKFLISKI